MAKKIESAMSGEIRKGFLDAQEDFNSMLSCAACRGKEYLEATKCESPSDYLRGWRLVAIDAKHSPHTCERV